MNREIKFRAWDGEKMVSVNDIVFSGKEPKAYWRENSVTETSSIINQFTGLHDKNGKEIYEGDILKWKCSKSGSNKVKVHLVTIEWCRHHYQLTIYDNKEKWATQKSFWNASDRELIGNIYENPELLKP